MLKGKKILLGITGSIAAYKSAFLVRLLVKSGAEVRVILTPSAKDFVTPLTLATLSKNPVETEFVESLETGEWVNHVDLGLWADLMIIAPATANTISKLALGRCDNLLVGTYLSSTCPVYIAPAMDLDMYKHGSTKDNLDKLQKYGNIIIQPGTGELASGLHGEGRMAEPEEIIGFIVNDLTKDLPLHGKKVLVTAGPTYEAIDPVRFIGNNSSGKMGFELAKSAANLGAKVTLISGPSSEKIDETIVDRINVVSAEEMLRACSEQFTETDIVIMAAAVADYTPLEKATEKIKKKTDEWNIDLKPTQDILQQLGQQKSNKQFLVGFALETNNEIENAKKKIKKKNLDFIVLNSLRDEQAGFGYHTNKITIIDKQNNLEVFELKNKGEVAKDILKKVVNLISS